jgi:hypothetical protein
VRRRVMLYVRQGDVARVGQADREIGCSLTDRDADLICDGLEPRPCFVAIGVIVRGHSKGAKNNRPFVRCCKDTEEDYGWGWSQ